ncbi:unnamed protein product [Bathycoccus prasinos]
MTLFSSLGISSGTLNTTSKSAFICARGREFHHRTTTRFPLSVSRFRSQRRDILTTAMSSSSSSPSLDDNKALKTKGWVVFSDLHVSRKTKDIALETLKYVHHIASNENRGILFLGDFWHHRGALPVETLNEIIRELAKWTQPTIMLVGNHDQVNVNGSVHALEVLRMCNPEKIVVFDEPRVWRGAMWLPYRKDQEMMRRTVEELMERHSKKRSSNVAVAVEEEIEEEIKTVFCHADVLGANVNQTFQMKNGVDSKETFSEEKTGIESIISGHYHKPHFVERDSRVRYVGSPYQISRAEKNQEKYLLFLNDKWRDESLTDADVLKRSKIDIGPRYFDIDETIGESIETIAGDLRANDIVRWTIPFDSSLSAMEEEDDDEEEKKKKKKKKKKTLSRSVPKRVENARLKYGCQIEVRRPPAALKSTIENAESLSPVDLFSSYAKSIRLTGGAKAFCEEIIAEATANSIPATIQTNFPRSAHLRKIEFDEVEITGFGAFKDEITYPLNDRGVVCVVGDNRDDSGFADSNGAGKTTLVTAVMWALTGKSDVRLDTGSTQKYLTNKDVVNDDSKSARVIVRGSLIDDREGDGGKKPFVIERAVTRTKLSKLSFVVNDTDETKLDSKKTQEHMDEIIGASVLAQTCFHGQHTIGSLLEASDAQLKNSFGSLVEQSVWLRCKNKSKKILKERREKLTIAKAELKSRESYVQRTRSRFLETEREYNRWKETFEEKVRAITIEREDALDALALDRMRNARKAVKEVKDIESVANEALRQILDINTNRNEFLDDAEDVSIQNRKAKENEQRHQQLDRDEQNLLKLFNDAQRNEASSRATAEQAHKSAGQVFNLSKQSVAVHQHAIDKETLKCTLCHQSIDPIKQKETFEQLKRDAEVMRLKHVAAIEALNDSRVKLNKFQVFKKSEIERMLNEERALQNLKFARVERENKKMMLTNELRRLVSLLVNVSERFSQMLPYVPEEVLALEKSFGDDGDALRLERRKRREQEQEQQSTKYAAAPAGFSSERGEALSGIAPGLLDYRTPYTSSSSRGYASSQNDENNQGKNDGFIQSNVVVANNITSLAQLLHIDHSSGLLADDASLPSFAKAVESKVAAAETLVAGCEKSLRDYERINQKYQQDVNTSDDDDASSFNINNNPHFEAMRQLQEQLTVETESLNDLKENSYSKIEFDLNTAKIADKCFSPTRGVSNYLFENVLAEVSERCQEYVFALTGGALSLQLVSSSSSFSSSSAAENNNIITFNDSDDDFDDDSIDEVATKATQLEKIERVIFARKQHSGEQYERSLRQLSGGERRRLAIGLALAYADVSARRLNVQSNLLILDEALQHLDSEGIERVVSVLRAIESEYSSSSSSSGYDDVNNVLLKKTVLLTTQADSETEKMFDGVDAVVKNKNRSEVLIGRGE